MAMGLRQRRRYGTMASKRLSGEPVLGLAQGSAGPQPRLLLIALVAGWILLTAVLSFIFRGVVGPGLLVVLIAWFALNKPRYLARTAWDVVVMKKGLLNNQPTRLIARIEPSYLDRPGASSGGMRHVDIGAEKLWVKETELKALAQDLT